MKKLGILILALILIGCQSGEAPAPEADGQSTNGNSSETTEEPVAPTPEPTPLPEPPAFELVVAGPEEIVFDWTTDRCEDENIPDIAPRAFRDAEGRVHLTVGHLNTYRMSGPDLDNVQIDCSAPISTSDLDPDPAMFNDGEWISSLYTEDGQTIYAVIHNEYRGHLHGDVRPDQCPSKNYLTCLDTSITMKISTDGGASFQDIAEAPNHLIATLPYTFNDQGIPSGLRQPTIIKGQDGYFYIFANISDYPEEEHRLCLMRTVNLDDPSSWRFWEGSDFIGEFVNPYIDADYENNPKCAPLDFPDIAASMTDSITYNTELGKYVLIGMAAHPTTTPEHLMWGVYYSFSDDLINWTRRRLLIELPMVASVADPASELIYAYPVLLDPDSSSLNFDTTDGEFYLYASKFYSGGGSLDRDIIRWPVKLSPANYNREAPVWEFNTDGDLEKWWLEYHLENANVSDGVLSMTSSGDDPVMTSAAIEFSAQDFGTLSITMKVSEGEQTFGEVFFLTDTDSVMDEVKHKTFDVISDGEFHTYDINMASVSGWYGLVTQIRIDPVVHAGRRIEIDKIEIKN